jgi:murein DD-endopeptidase MepM/ murein hydrolase activator NlpD
MKRKYTVPCMSIVPLCAIILMSFSNKQSEVPSETAYVPQNAPDIAPVDLTKVTKVVLYGQRADRTTNQLRNHTGIDFEITKGSDVVSTADGIVVVQRVGELRGLHVIIKHNETFSTRYFHLESALVKQGDTVKKGEVIGLVGNTGLSSVPHLHYEILKNDATIDPKNYLPKLPGS